MFSVAMADTINAKSILQNNASLSDYFAQQFEHLTPFNVLVALLLGLVVGAAFFQLFSGAGQEFSVVGHSQNLRFFPE